MEPAMGGIISTGCAQGLERREIVLVGIVVDIKLAHFGGRIDLELQPGAAEITQRLRCRFRARGGQQIVFYGLEIVRHCSRAFARQRFQIGLGRAAQGLAANLIACQTDAEADQQSGTQQRQRQFAGDRHVNVEHELILALRNSHAGDTRSPACSSRYQNYPIYT